MLQPQFALFLDHLGQSGRLKRIADQDPFAGEIPEDVQSAFDSAFDPVSKIRSRYERVVTALQEVNIDTWTEGVPTSDHSAIRQAFGHEVGFRAFSDSVLAWTKFASPDGTLLCAPMGILTTFMTTASLLQVSIAEGSLLRGGAEIALGTFFDEEDNEPYGAASWAAYNLESRVAIYPRVVLGENLMNYLTKCSNTNGATATEVAPEFGAKMALSWTTQDFDGQPILDVFGRESAELAKLMEDDNDPHTHRARVYQASIQRLSQQLKEDTADDPRVRMKIEYLIGQAERNRAYWTD